jgi:hypothetical protein
MQNQARSTHRKACLRAIKTTVVAALGVGLLAGSSFGVAAQDEAEAPFETPVYYTWENGDWVDFEEGTFDEETGVLTGRSGGSIPLTASDPRFNSTAWVTINGHTQENGDDIATIEARSWHIEDDFGCTWTGTSTFVLYGSRPEPPAHVSEAFIGTGGGPCEGMTMWATGDYKEGSAGEAVILGAPLPPMPDAPEEKVATAQ